MDNSVKKPLLLSDHGVEPDDYVINKSCFLKSTLKWTLKIVMWVIFIAWVGLIFLYPGELGTELVNKIRHATEGTIFGISGSLFLAFSAPILIIAFLAAAHLIISGEDVFEKRKTTKSPRFRLWTFPVLVDGPFGVVSAAELIGIILVVVFIIWAAYAYTMRNLSFMTEFGSLNVG
ncbi:putative ferric-chelate reductase [Corchorus olitorius]|uniref:Ferric-chelate reductase n=1 Tax=Corchorus olitorius TaxID=93759 RepID=A0A1R3KLX8_9ROSI|nr:putative ferric-chelate reductase [Corchorus olitorius]